MNPEGAQPIDSFLRIFSVSICLFDKHIDGLALKLEQHQT